MVCRRSLRAKRLRSVFVIFVGYVPCHLLLEFRNVLSSVSDLFLHVVFAQYESYLIASVNTAQLGYGTFVRGFDYLQPRN